MVEVTAPRVGRRKATPLAVTVSTVVLEFHSGGPLGATLEPGGGPVQFRAPVRNEQRSSRP